MKYSSMLLASLLCLAPTIGFAQESKTEKMAADKSVQKSQRQAILGMSHLGLQAKDYSLPVYYTPAGKNAKTRLLGNWNVSIDQDYADNVLATNYGLLISNRYDKIIMNGDKTMVVTPTKDIDVKLGSVKDFSFDTGAYKAYHEAVLKYLNGEIAGKTQKVLAEATEARFSQMDEAQAQTFIQTKAKETGIDTAMLEKLINSSFAFSLYLPKVRGTLSIKQDLHEGIKGNYYTYTTTLNMPVNTMLLVYKFNGKTFDLYKEVNSRATGLAAMAKGMSGSSSITTKYQPNKEHAQKIFDDAFTTSFKDTFIAISTRLKADRAFAISAPIDNAEAGQVDISVGIQQDIRVDHPMKVFRTIDGSEQEVGLFKVRSAGNNCALTPADKQTQSKADVIIGEAETADLAVEHPWTGVYGSIFYNYTGGAYDFTNMAVSAISDYSASIASNTATSSGDTNMVGISFNADLGYILNMGLLSETWLSLGGAFGLAGNAGDLPTIGGTDFSQAGGFGFKASAGLEKRIYVAPSTFVGLGAELGLDAASYGVSGLVTQESLSMINAYVLPQVRVGYTPDVNLEIVASLGYNIPVMTTASYSWTVTGADSSLTTSFDGVSRGTGIDARVGVSYHLDFAGPFAKMFKLPSSKCDALKAQQGAK